jgi:FKBP-type peptidyl-prolyl cis-trans isomerase 2
VTGSNDGTAKVWDANSGKKLFTLIGHGGNIHSVAFSPDGQRILTGSRDGTAKLWEAGSGRDLLTLKGHGDWILSVAFSPDGHQIVTGGWDRTAKLWVAAAPQQVAVWQREEKADTERPPVLNGRGLNEESLAEHERSLRSLDPGAIKEWLVLAPIAFEGRTDEAALRALDQEQLPQEAGLRARAGDRVTVGASELVWKGVQLEDYLIDFNHLSGKATTWSAAYAICYIQSEAVRTGLLMKVSSNGQAKIYLNGNQIYRNDRRRPYEPDQDVLEGVELKAGVNVLVFKVVNEEHDWQGSVWLTDAAGQPVKGIRVTLTPP